MRVLGRLSAEKVETLLKALRAVSDTIEDSQHGPLAEDLKSRLRALRTI